MSSLLAFQGVPPSANYAATKAFIQTLAEGLRLELEACGAYVLAVARGALAALGRRGTTRPGRLSKLLEAPLAPLSRSLRVRMMGRVMAGMTKRGP